MEESLNVIKTKRCSFSNPDVVFSQSGSMILEALIVLGMIATFTPLLYKHVADRRADIENINRANTLLYLQQKTEEYLKDPDNINALVDELGHNQHKEIFPSELGVGDNFDGRYIIGIRREDENNKPVLKAMIIDTVNTGSDLRAAKVAELIGISAGIYTAVDPDAAWGINGMWSEPLSRYFTTTDIPTGAVAVTTEYNKEKYKVNISDVLVDSNLDMGEFELTAEQINAINLAAQNGTIDQITTTDARASNKVVAGTKLCLGGEEDAKCIESWEGLGGGGDRSDLALVQLCNAGLSEICTLAFMKDLNTSCSKVDAVFDRFRVEYPNPKIYNITYGSVNTYEGYVRTKCEGTQFIVDNISTPNLSNPVEQVGDSAFGITTPGWYQLTLMGQQGLWTSTLTNINTNSTAGGILISNCQYNGDEILTLKAIKGGEYVGSGIFGGAGVALWDTINTTSAPILVAGGGTWGSTGGGGYNGGKKSNISDDGITSGYSWDGTAGNNTTYCSSADCNIGATGGRWWYPQGNWGGYGGTGYCGSGYACTTIAGGNGANGETSDYTNYPNSYYGNWSADSYASAYASIIYCGTSESDCPVACGSDSDCPSDIPYCSDGACTATKSCTASSQCTAASLPYCVENLCSDTCTADSQCPTATPYCNSGVCETTKSCSIDSDCPSAIPYCNSGICEANKACTADSDCTNANNKPYCRSGYCSNVFYSASNGQSQWLGRIGGVVTAATLTILAGRYKFDLRGGGIRRVMPANSGTWTVTKTFASSTSLQIKWISGGWCRNGSKDYLGGNGVGLWEGGTLKLVAGGGADGMAGGGGYRGGDSRQASACPDARGYAYNGRQDNSQATSGAGGGGSISIISNVPYGWGGTGACSSDYSGSGTYATWGGNASITITYCGPNASSTCP